MNYRNWIFKLSILSKINSFDPSRKIERG